MAERVMEALPGLLIHVYPVRNDFFGERITVSGLLTGQDLAAQLSGKDLGSALFLPENVLRSGEDVFLDDLHVADLEKALQVPVNIVKSSGYEFVDALLAAVRP
jgi:NifB/MoaA-like Fe-S oxidoreductase